MYKTEEINDIERRIKLHKEDIKKILLEYESFFKEDKKIFLNLEQKINEILESRFPTDENYLQNYSAEIVKYYDCTSQTGITIKAEFNNGIITNIEGFSLNFNFSELEDLSQNNIKDVYDSIKLINDFSNNENWNKDISQIVIYKHTNKDVCNLQYEKIRNNFISLNKKDKEDEESEEP